MAAQAIALRMSLETTKSRKKIPETFALKLSFARLIAGTAEPLIPPGDK